MRQYDVLQTIPGHNEFSYRHSEEWCMDAPFTYLRMEKSGEPAPAGSKPGTYPESISNMYQIKPVMEGPSSPWRMPGSSQQSVRFADTYYYFDSGYLLRKFRNDGVENIIPSTLGTQETPVPSFWRMPESSEINCANGAH